MYTYKKLRIENGKEKKRERNHKRGFKWLIDIFIIPKTDHSDTRTITKLLF